MADHTLALSNSEEIVLAMWLERINAQRATELDENGNPPPTLNADQLLHFAVRNDLNNLRQELNESTQQLFQITRALTTAQRTAVLGQLPDGPYKQWLQGRITQGA